MNQPEPYDFSVSPYGRTPKPSGRSVFQPLLWLVAAGLAGVGPFLPVHEQDLGDPTAIDPSQAANQSVITNGWGHVHGSTHGTIGADFTDSYGPQYGIVFVAAAVLMLVTAIWLVSNARTRYLTPTAPGLLGTAALAGSLAMFVVVYWGEISGDDLAQLHFRSGFYCEIAAVALGLIGALGYRIGQFRADDPDRAVEGSLVP